MKTYGLLPPGVTKRYVDGLLSRRWNPFSISGNAVVCCMHGREKRSVVEAEFPATAHPHLCPCCENLYPGATDVPGFPCPTCEPRRAAR